MLNFGVRYLLRIKTKLLKDRSFSRIISWLEKSTNLENGLTNIGFKQFPFDKNGHTVCVLGYKQQLNKQ